MTHGNLGFFVSSEGLDTSSPPGLILRKEVGRGWGGWVGEGGGRRGRGKGYLASRESSVSTDVPNHLLLSLGVTIKTFNTVSPDVIPSG